MRVDAYCRHECINKERTREHKIHTIEIYSARNYFDTDIYTQNSTHARMVIVAEIIAEATQPRLP